MIYNNIYELLASILLSNCKEIYRCDNPRTLTIAWISTDFDIAQDDKFCWDIAISYLKHSFNNDNVDNESKQLIKQFMCSKNKNVCEELKKIPHIRKLSKLKAFW